MMTAKVKSIEPFVVHTGRKKCGKPQIQPINRLCRVTKYNESRAVGVRKQQSRKSLLRCVLKMHRHKK